MEDEQWPEEREATNLPKELPLILVDWKVA